MIDVLYMLYNFTIQYHDTVNIQNGDVCFETCILKNIMKCILDVVTL